MVTLILRGGPDDGREIELSEGALLPVTIRTLNQPKDGNIFHHDSERYSKFVSVNEYRLALPGSTVRRAFDDPEVNVYEFRSTIDDIHA